MNIVFLFYDGMTALDAIGPHEILSRIPGVTIQRVALHAGIVRTESASLHLQAEYALSDVSQADVLLIPGAGNATSLQHQPDMLAWVRHIHATTQWTTSVCTGSLILGAAGLLKGQRATSHWAVLDRLPQWGAEPIAERIVESGKIMTSAGVSAGIDMALLLTEKIAGRTIAETIQLGVEYDPHPPFHSGSPTTAAPDIVNALRARLIRKFE